MKRTLIVIMLALLMAGGLYAQAAGEDTSSFVASTTWTAAFADLAGVDEITVIAPATLRHPPEYELVPSDIVTIQNARFFVSAGYERMMSTIQEGIPSDERVDIHITTENDRRNVALMADLIASYTGTDVRYEDYVEMMDEAALRIEELGLDGLRVWCQGMLTPMAEDLGLDVVATFSGELTPSQIEEASSGAYDLILDNYHNPSTSPLEGVVDCPIVTWRNFPETSGRGALEDMMRANIDAVLELYD